MYGDCYCVEKMRPHVLDLDNAVLDTLEAQSWKNLRVNLLAERG